MSENSTRPNRRRARPKGGNEIFVSHATADKWLARVICEKLESVGAKTFRDDRDIHGGDDIPDEIRRHIRRCSEFLVLLTPESVHRQWVLLEVGAAWGWRVKRRITAVLCHVDTDRIPDMIKSKKAINLNDFDQYLAEVAARVPLHKSRGTS
jgi:hypothetical protein